MMPLSKKDQRRMFLMSEHWLRFHGDASRPRFAARQARRALKIWVAEP